MKGLTVGALLGLLVSNAVVMPASAQEVEQTVEGAQKFLEMALPGNAYRSGGFTDWDLAQKDVHFRSEDPILTAVSVEERCRIRLEHRDFLIEWDNRSTRQRGYDTFDKLVPEHLRGKVLAFADVKEVKASGADVTVLVKGFQNGSRFRIGAENLAARVAYAMEFLRIKCDPTVATGF